MIKNVFLFIFLLSAGFSSCQVANNPKPSTSICDSLILNVGSNWKQFEKRNTSNANFVKAIVKNKNCFVGKDSVEVVRIFGAEHKIINHKKVKNTLYYRVVFDKESSVGLFFVLDSSGKIEDVDVIYLDGGHTVN